MSIKVAEGALDCCKTADSLTEPLRCAEQPEPPDSGWITRKPEVERCDADFSVLIELGATHEALTSEAYRMGSDPFLPG